MLKLILESLDGVEENVKGLYRKGQDGKFYLDTEEDANTKKRLDEFRENNIKLMKDKEELEKKLKDVDPVKYKEMLAKIQAIEDKQMIEAGKLDELVNQKTERMRIEYDNHIKELTAAIELKDKEILSGHTRLSEVLIDSELTKALTKIGGVRAGAMEDLIARGRRMWALIDGKPVPKEGDRIIYGKDGKEMLTFDEWAKIQTETAPYFFESSSGSGSHGSQQQQSGSVSTKKLAELPPAERLKVLHEKE